MTEVGPPLAALALLFPGTMDTASPSMGLWSWRVGRPL